jgi:hypothetical protein
MKRPPWFNRNLFFSLVRIATAGTLIFAAAAIAFVAAKPFDPTLFWKADNKSEAIKKFGKDRHQVVGSKRFLPGLERNDVRLLAAEEEYAKRAYPATDIPFSATLGARAAFDYVRARTAANETVAALPTAAWTLIGPSTTNVPSILTYSGTQYFASGRITALAIAPNCSSSNCRLWTAAAGGGIWRTDNALSTTGPSWTFISGSFATNAIGTLTYDAATATLYAGTGEPNASVDSEAGMGIYKSTDGGNTWTRLNAHTSVAAITTSCGTAPAYSGPAFNGRAISSIVVDGSTIYVGSTRGVRGVSSVLEGGVISRAPGLPPFGVWKSTDGGANFTLLNAQGVCLPPKLTGEVRPVQSSFGSPRGVNHVTFDPKISSTIYAASFQKGIWRSTNSGVNWTQIKKPLTSTDDTDRAEFAVTTLGNGSTRMYIGVGNRTAARFYRSDHVATGLVTFSDLTTTQNINYCVPGCGYSNGVISPVGNPDTVYLLGFYDYDTSGFESNGRGVLYSSNAGASFTDETWDATTNVTPAGTCCQPNSIAPHGLHPDQHALVVSPANPGLFFEGSDGGLVRSSGSFANISSQCTSRGLSGANLTLCQQLLSRVPTVLFNLNKGLSTLQFQSLSVAPDDPNHLQGGTQDNGTLERTSTSLTWPQIINGDGGQSGFSANNSHLRFNTFMGSINGVNFRNGNASKWVFASGPIANSTEGSYFYPPVTADPNLSDAGTIFQGSQSVWRTQDWGGNQAFLEANCPAFFTPETTTTCGDFVPLGSPGARDLTSTSYGTRAGGFIAAIERAKSDTETLWVATGTGRVFVSKNANAASGDVSYTRLDSLPGATAAPNRFVSSIYVDPTDANHAWISYSSYNLLTPSKPGHVFEVTFNPVTSNATWKDLDGGTGPMGDLPVTDLVRDDVTSDLYASTDFGVLRLPKGSSSWVVAGSGLPMVEVAGLTIAPGARVLYAATHGRSAWKLTLP